MILSGPTHEHLDPVRYIGNASSGKTGQALAEEALRRGMDVDFISGPVAGTNLPPVKNTVLVTSAEEMLDAAREKFDAADIIIFAAAVADFRPVRREPRKIEKAGRRTLELEPTPDIAATLCANKRKGQIAIGFALQTHDGEAAARAKRISKHLDGIVLNTPASLGAASGVYAWIDEAGVEPWGALAKAECAANILDRAVRLSQRPVRSA